MKRQFLHEAHGRQDKAHKPDYQEEMREKRPSSAPTVSQVALAALRRKRASIPRRKITSFSPEILTALRQLNPAINITQLLQAVNSVLGQPCYTDQRGDRPFTNTPLTFVQFMHDFDNFNSKFPGCAISIPGEFHYWLAKFVPKPPPPPPSQATNLENPTITSQ
jgi:hypothetical protein